MIGKARKYCAPRRVGYPLQFLDLAVDAYARLVYHRRRRATPAAYRPAVLVMTSGHLGDALILSYVFPLIHQRYPGAQIDVIVGSWCDPIWTNNPYVRRVIHLDHPVTSRRAVSPVRKWHLFGQMTRTVVSRLRREEYDYSVDVRFSSAPMHYLLPFLRVKRCIGFGCRGWGGLLDDEFFLPDDEFHNFSVISKLFEKMDVAADVRTVVPYFPTGRTDPEQVWIKLGLPAPTGPVVLLFPETGSPERQMPATFWYRVVTRLLRQQPETTLVFGGQMPATDHLYETVRQQHPTASHRLLSAVGRLNLQELALLARQATFALTLDSLPAHLCVIFCPTVSFFNGGMGLQFFPIGNKPTFVFHNHPASRNLTIDRPGFVSAYVDRFDEAVIEQAVQVVSEKISQ